jgi:histidinol phosphatase-like PHP family hydrolase
MSNAERHLSSNLSRRGFLAGATALVCASDTLRAQQPPELGFPVEDFHVHLGPGFSIDDAVAASRERGTRFGILEHAGTRENEYPIVLSNDKELQDWIAKLDGKPVYKGIQAEFIDWMPCFSKDVLAQLDFVLTDAMTARDANGKRVKMWLPAFEPGEALEFMDMLVKWTVEIIEREPLDIFSHPLWIPRKFAAGAEKLWTPERTKPIIDALKRTGTALEIDAARLPGLDFLKMAKEARIKFSFGSNSGANGRVRGLDYCFEMARALNLTKEDMFAPARKGRKPVQRRKLVS